MLSSSASLILLVAYALLFLSWLSYVLCSVWSYYPSSSSLLCSALALLLLQLLGLSSVLSSMSANNVLCSLVLFLVSM